MLKLLKISLRALYKSRLYTVVNILGLAISLACVVIIARYVHQETTVNHFAKDIDRTYISSVEFQNRQPLFAEIRHFMGDANSHEIEKDPAVEMISHFMDFEDGKIAVDENTYIINSMAVDSNFIKILPYPVLLGIVEFKHPNDVLMTQHLARKIFGDVNPVGQTITYSGGESLQIIGVIGEPRTKTSFNFDLLVNYDLKDNWYRSGHELVLLREGTNREQVNLKYAEFTHLTSYGENGRFQLFPFKDFYSNQTHTLYQYENPVLLRSNSGSLKVLSMVAVFILLVGIFNFINIYHVVSMRRARGLGIRAVHGARPRDIFSHIYLENAVMVVIALFLCWWLIELIGMLLYKQLGFSVKADSQFDLILSATVLLLLPLLTALYPFSRYLFSTPITSLQSVNVGGVSSRSRDLFLFLQYTITFGLLVISLFFMKQIRYMLDADLGYNTENVMMCTLMSMPVIDLASPEAMQEYGRALQYNSQLIKQKMDESTLFTEWTQGRALYKTEATYPVSVEGKDDWQQVSVEFTDLSYMNLFDFQLLEGRLWDTTDVLHQYKCIINESARKMLGIQDFRSSHLRFQRRLWITGSSTEDMSLNPSYEIVGVVKDFNTGHLSKSTAPLVFVFYERANPFSFLMGRFLPGKEEEAAAYLEELHREINGNADFEYSLLEDNIASLYEKDRQVSNVYVTFSILAMFISCLGLFALSLFDMQQRHREIALRKINGATRKDIMILLLKKYARLLGASFLISIPLSYFVIHRYLEDFAYKASISWWLFAIAGIVVTGVSLGTLMGQASKAMRINPVNALKAE
ncbi:MAG: FtsX-like permease family protein [Proteiniphilum sp.]